jgi:hypothetical protein
VIRLQIKDKDGNIIQEDELVLEDGDILLCQVNGELTHQMNAKLSDQLRQGFQLAAKRSNDGEIVPILYDHTIDFKVLKIRPSEE